MSIQRAQNEYARQILQSIASGRPVTQRALAGELGVALGLTNLLIRRLVAKGCVKVAGMGTRHVRYLMTAQGIEALGRATRHSLENTVTLYTQTREQIRASLARVSQQADAAHGHQTRVVFYGAGDVAEIAYVSLQSTDLNLVGVVDDRRTGFFFGLPIHRSDLLSASGVGATAYDHVIVTSLKHATRIRARLAQRAIPEDRVSYL